MERCQLLRPTRFWILLRPPRQVIRLDGERALLEGARPLWEGFLGWLPPSGLLGRTYVLQEGGRPVGFLQLGRHPFLEGWQLRWLGLWHPDGVELLEAGLEAAVQATGEQGLPRLHAALWAGTPEVEAALAREGFRRYAEEEVWLLRDPGPPGVLPPDLSVLPQLPGDTWSVHRFYLAHVPPRLRQAEGIRAGFWALPPLHRRELGWVAWRESRPVAYLRWQRGRRGGVLHVWADPALGEELVEVVRHVWPELPRPARLPAYLLMRYPSPPPEGVRQALGARSGPRLGRWVRFLGVPAAARVRPARVLSGGVAEGMVRTVQTAQEVGDL